MEFLGVVIAAGMLVALMTEDRAVRWIAIALVLISLIQIITYVSQ